MNPASSLERIRIVLCETTHPGNIGATARAMKTMGLRDLRLVNPRYFPHPDATARAAGASDILNTAAVCSNLDEALLGTVTAIGCSARKRDLSLSEVSFREAANLAMGEYVGQDVAMVFGTEMSGLTTQELNKCQYIAYIPTNPEYSSLNLAAAVQVIAYELRLATNNSSERLPREYKLAKFEEVEFLYQDFEQKMIATGFLNPEEPKRLMQRIRRMFARSKLERQEVNILRGFLNAIEKH